MKVKRILDGEAAIAFSRDDLAFLGFAIGEALQVLEEWEFPIRAGEKPERAREIAAELLATCRKMKKQ